MEDCGRVMIVPVKARGCVMTGELVQSLWLVTCIRSNCNPTRF